MRTAGSRGSLLDACELQSRHLHAAHRLSSNQVALKLIREAIFCSRFGAINTRFDTSSVVHLRSSLQLSLDAFLSTRLFLQRSLPVPLSRAAYSSLKSVPENRLRKVFFHHPMCLSAAHKKCVLCFFYFLRSINNGTSNIR